MRRARIQIKPNVAKAAKQAAPAPEVVPPPVAQESVIPEVASEEVVMTQNSTPSPAPSDDAPSESMKSLHVDVSRNHHVHFTEDVVDNEKEGEHQNNNSTMVSPTSFATPRLMTPRSRNVSMCEDEAILQPKQAREKKRFSGKEALDTKTWKMADLARWNPRNEQTSFKRERRSSTSSSIITKSEAGDFDSPTPRINAPQVKIGLDGRLVIDETSLVVQSAQINHESVWENVEEGRMGSKITSMSFRNRIFRKANMWSEKETDLFYEVLQCTGTDFGLMHHYLPQRSRPELKAKYNREEKNNWTRLLKAISHPTRLDGELEVRIAKVMAEIEFEIQEKKVIKEYEKEEERKIREEIRLQKATEKAEEKMKKLQAKELLRQARELEKDARNAQKLSDMLSERAEKEARAREKSETRQLEKVEREKERMDVKRLAEEARKCAMEAKRVINEKRKAEAQGKRAAKVQAESHNLEREAERIIRRLIQESQREEKKKAQESKKAPKKTEEAAPTTSTPAPDDSGEEEMSSDSSESPESSDEDAIPADTARREKQRMKEAKLERTPRQTVVDHKPVYVTSMDVKYAEKPVNKAVEMALMAKGNLFDSADEDFEVPEQMDTTPAPDDSQPGPAPPPAPVEPEEPEEEPVPQAVTDVIEEMGRCRSKTPVAEEQKEPEKVPEKAPEEGTEEPKKKKAKIPAEPKKAELKKSESKQAEPKKAEPEKHPEEDTEEPKKKKAKIQAEPKKAEPEKQPEVSQQGDSEVLPVENYDSNLYEEFVDVEALSPEPYFRVALRHPPSSPIPSTSTAPPEPTPSTSTAPESASAPSEAPPGPPKPTASAAPRRTVKKPVFLKKKK